MILALDNGWGYKGVCSLGPNRASAPVLKRCTLRQCLATCTLTEVFIEEGDKGGWRREDPETLKRQLEQRYDDLTHYAANRDGLLPVQ